MNKYLKLVSNVMTFALGAFSSKILVFLLMPLYTRLLTTYDYGVIDNIVNTANLMIPIVSLSITEGVIRFSLDKSIKKSDAFSTGIKTVIIGFAVFSFFVPVFLKIKFIAPYTALIYLYVLMACLRSVCSQFVRALGLIRLYTFDGVATTAIVILFNIVFLIYFKMGITGYVLSIILTDVVSVIFLFWSAKLNRYFKPFNISPHISRQMLKYSIPMIPNTLFWWITNASDRYIVTYYMGADINGLYAAAYKIPTIITTISGIFMQGWQLSAISEYSNHDKSVFYSNIFKYFQSLIFLCASGIVLFIKVITVVLVAPDYYPSWQYVPLLVIASVFSSLAIFYNSIYMSAKKSTSIMVTTFIGAALNVAMNFMLIPRYGANGAAFATFASYFIVFVIRVIDSHRFSPFSIDAAKFAVNFMLLSVQIAIMLSEVKHWAVYEIILVLIMISINIKNFFDAVIRIVKSRKKA
ncbi:MAG TPA: hypothetical protein DCP97_05225 [Ruminococcaceae bacterium]|nr:hypothetical protein [Oscillospiraceae bacterium]